MPNNNSLKLKQFIVLFFNHRSTIESNSFMPQNDQKSCDIKFHYYIEQKLSSMEASKTVPIGMKQPPPIKSRSTNKVIDYEVKLSQAIDNNIKLKELMQVIRNNSLARKVQASQISDRSQENQNVLTLKKRKEKLMADIQHLTNNLNCLMNDNNKLKVQVDSSRSSRVIYSNVYKELEKQIHQNEYRYQSTLIDLICYEETGLKVRQKLEKARRKLEKEVNQLEGVSFAKKKEKRKITRIDTGLSSYRDSKLASKDTNRNSSKEIKSNAALSTKRDQILQEESCRRQQSKQIGQSRQRTQRSRLPEFQTSVKAVENKTKLIAAQNLNDYYDLEMKSDYYDSVVSRLQKICGAEAMEEISKCWKNIDAEIEQEYQKYLSLEESIRKIEEEAANIRQASSRNVNQESRCEKNVEEIELGEIEEQLERERKQVQQLESEITILMDLNCHKLSDEEIHQHIMRIKRRGMAYNKELDKLLESACKEKSINNSLKGSRIGM